MRLLYKSLNKHNAIVSTNSFYVTTPIYYVNASPHIGHLYSSVIADAAYRWRKLLFTNEKLKFATGTDEHGTKIQQAATLNKTTPKEYCDLISNKYKSTFDAFNINYTDFIRTTDEKHKIAVQHFWNKLCKKGCIYSSNYSGWYCVSDETFLVDTQLKEITTLNGTRKMVSAESGHSVEWTEEQNYMFKLNSFQDDIKYWLQRENVIRPKKFQKILLDLLDDGLPDLSVSRPSERVHWGLRVPDDDSQSIYVWMDALINYLTAAGYPDEKYTEFWPCDLHVIGKDILKFHGIYWPAFLMAADIEPPKSILCHSHWTVDNEKMSKSKGNVVCPLQQSDLYTFDGFRYFLLREGVPHSDGNYSDTKVLRILNSELADTLGNLLSRCTGKALNPQQVFPAIENEIFERLCRENVTKKLVDAISNLPDICHQHYSIYKFYKVVDETIAALHAANLFFETMKPWELKKLNKLDELDVVLHLTLETLRICGIILSPIIPTLSNTLLDRINVRNDKRMWLDTQILSWNDSNFQTIQLKQDKSILFKRIVSNEEIKVVKDRH